MAATTTFVVLPRQGAGYFLPFLVYLFSQTRASKTRKPQITITFKLTCYSKPKQMQGGMSKKSTKHA